MIEIDFCKTFDDALLQFAVIIARYGDRWVFCRHRERETLECPAGHREPGEAILAAARRELWEETGAEDYTLTQLCPYSVADSGIETFGMLFYADIRRFGPLPPFEIAEVLLLDNPPSSWTYPDIQPRLLEKAAELMGIEVNA